MQVNYIPSHNGKAHIKVPKSMLAPSVAGIGNPKYVRFVIMTTKPGLVNPDSSINGTSTATDVCPGGMNSLEGGIIYNYAEYMPPKPGTSITITTIKTTYYIYGGNNVLCELSPDGSTTAKYVYGQGKLIAKADAFGRHFYTPDALGSSRIVTNLSGVVEQKCSYYPFGSQLTDSGTAVANYKYTGKEWDGDEGLYYYGARYYDPELGRFYSIDPIGSAAASPYAYCGNNPMNFVDPTGMLSSYVYPAYWWQDFGSGYTASEAWKYSQSIKDPDLGPSGIWINGEWWGFGDPFYGLPAGGLGPSGHVVWVNQTIIYSEDGIHVDYYQQYTYYFWVSDRFTDASGDYMNTHGTSRWMSGKRAYDAARASSREADKYDASTYYGDHYLSPNDDDFWAISDAPNKYGQSYEVQLAVVGPVMQVAVYGTAAFLLWKWLSPTINAMITGEYHGEYEEPHLHEDYEPKMPYGPYRGALPPAWPPYRLPPPSRLP